MVQWETEGTPGPAGDTVQPGQGSSARTAHSCPAGTWICPQQCPPSCPHPRNLLNRTQHTAETAQGQSPGDQLNPLHPLQCFSAAQHSAKCEGSTRKRGHAPHKDDENHPLHAAQGSATCELLSSWDLRGSMQMQRAMGSRTQTQWHASGTPQIMT